MRKSSKKSRQGSRSKTSTAFRKETCVHAHHRRGGYVKSYWRGSAEVCEYMRGAPNTGARKADACKQCTPCTAMSKRSSNASRKTPRKVSRKQPRTRTRIFVYASKKRRTTSKKQKGIRRSRVSRKGIKRASQKSKRRSSVSRRVRRGMKHYYATKKASRKSKSRSKVSRKGMKKASQMSKRRSRASRKGLKKSTRLRRGMKHYYAMKKASRTSKRRSKVSRKGVKKASQNVAYILRSRKRPIKKESFGRTPAAPEPEVTMKKAAAPKPGIFKKKSPKEAKKQENKAEGGKDADMC